MERVIAALGFLLLAFPGAMLAPLSAADEPPSTTLCILDFTRIGDEGSMDWLAQGLADMMITTLGRTSPYSVVEREHLQAILREQGLAVSGLLDPEWSIKAGRLAKAQFLLTGNFAVRKETVTVQVRLLRIADQKLVSRAAWEGTAGDVLLAPRALSRSLLAGLATPFDEKFLTGMEREMPRTVDVAESFYRGMKAFDGGDYHLALGHYLEGSRAAGDFLRVRRETFRMYYLLGRSDHAVLFALKTGRLLQGRDLPRALEFLHLASQKAVEPLGRPVVAIGLLEKIDRLARRSEKSTGEAARTKDFVRRRLLSLSDAGTDRTGPELLADHDVRWRIWTAEIPGQLERRARAGDYGWVRRGGSWVKERLPEPSVFMWRIRAMLDLARLLVKQGRLDEGLGYYRAILEEYAFLNDLPPFDGRTRFYWDEGIRLEAHFMILRHLGLTGRLIRDPVLMPRLNEAGDDVAFRRDFSNPEPDPRARVWSQRAEGGHEFFDFAAPEGRQITRVVFESEVRGPAWLSLYLPDARGWPPQFDFSRRKDKVALKRGRHARTFDLPEGTTFLSLSVLWGPRWASTFPGHMSRRPDTDRRQGDIAWWEATFTFSPTEATAGDAESRDSAGDEKLLRHYAGRWGWDEGVVVRDGAAGFSGTPPMDVHDEAWIALTMGGDLAVYHRDSLRAVELPLTVNTDEEEFEPWLTQTREGGYALLWSRGLRGRPSGQFVSRTKDFLDWETPKRMVFEEPPQRGGPRRLLDRGSVNVVPVSGGYLMLLHDGWVRYSSDLVTWEEPKRLFDYDGLRQRIVRTGDGRIWAVATRADDLEVPSGGKTDRRFGYFKSADGRLWQKREAVIVYHSLDGRRWSDGVTAHIGGEPSGLWVLPLSTDSIAVAVGYNNLNLRWLVAGGPKDFHSLSSPVRLPLNSSEAHFFIRDGKLWCARAVHDFIDESFVLLLSGSVGLYQRIAGSRP